MLNSIKLACGFDAQIYLLYIYLAIRKLSETIDHKFNCSTSTNWRTGSISRWEVLYSVTGKILREHFSARG